MPNTSSIVEVRIPTYNRPVLLRRALNALLAQSHATWRAVILDDGNSAQQVVDDIGDSRISCSPNPKRLGPDFNIIRAFSREPMAGGSFFYVLEDDNLIMPTFFEDNLRWMSTHDVGLVINNQWVEVLEGDPGAPPKHDNQSTIDCFSEGVWSVDDVKIALLWRMPISNGSIFWRGGCRSDFSGGGGYDPALHEWMRAWRLADDIYFNETPNAFWYPTPADPPVASLKAAISGMQVFLERERTVQAMRRNILAKLQQRGETGKLLSDRYKTPLAVREEGVLKAYGRWPGPSQLSAKRRVKLLAKALLLRAAIRSAPL